MPARATPPSEGRRARDKTKRPFRRRKHKDPTSPVRAGRRGHLAAIGALINTGCIVAVAVAGDSNDS